MKILIIFSFIFFFNIPFNQACNLAFENHDKLNIIRNSYERDIFNITGELEFCPPSIRVQNISILNPILKRLSILNVSYIIETNRMNITALARLIGFAPLTIQLYFRDNRNFRSTERQNKNATIEQQTCVRTSSNRQEILRNCPMLTYENNHYVLSQQINVAIKRHQSIIDVLFTVVVTFLVTLGTLCIGCGLELEQLITNLKRPMPLIVGLFCQIIYLPCLSMGLAKAFRLDNSTSLGLISTASSPGGGSSNIYTALLAGDIDLSVSMTFLSTILAFGTFPFWVWLFGQKYVDFKILKFPWWSMFISIFTLVIPAIIGLLLRRYRPVLAHRIGRYLNPIAVGYLVFIVTFGVYINMYIFHIIDYKAIMAGCFLPWFGFMGGAIVSLIGIRDKKKTIAICIETGVQNTAVSIFFLRLTFLQPESDVALANPILVSMAIPIPFLVLVLTRSIMNRFSFCRKFLPQTKATKKAIENGTDETPEKALMKELLEEKQEQTDQIDKVES